ncbi:hypothetical protein [Pararhizobium haloflavum]|uniref:hypothetical protein n=1 Tax=Pararhizobium haloflavum TaxID=2037914 RepID=UPI000C18BFAA|nr:hypothetical protein [Pararhizobium haloflavum]
MADLAPFDPGDDFDAMAERFRLEIANMAIRARSSAVFRGLTQVQQVQCLMAGIMTGLVGTCFAYIEPDGRDAMIEAIADYLPHARMNAEEITEPRP